MQDHVRIEDFIIGESPKIKTLISKIKKIADTDSAVLIYGETGTGKDLAASMLHRFSRRADKPFVSRNCSAIPQNLIESLLFGTSKGSFTGAEDRIGVFESANGGTIFLDEINSSGMDLQSKILRVIELKKVVRVGEMITRPLDIRIIAGMNQPPNECISKKLLRLDLYYRLATVQLHIPPLRERRTDIPLLIDHFIRQNNQLTGRKIRGLSASAREIIAAYDWPGNIRELKNAVESAMIFAEGSYIKAEDLPEYITEEQIARTSLPGSFPASCDMKLQDYINACEASYILEKMQNYDTLSELADYLGISRQTLNYKLRKYNIVSPK